MAQTSRHSSLDDPRGARAAADERASGKHPQQWRRYVRDPAGPEDFRLPGAHEAGDLERVLMANLHANDSTWLESLQLDRLLGVGSMGIVYLARLMGQRVVCKVIDHSSFVLKRHHNRLQQARLEALVSHRLRHMNIAATYAFFSGNVHESLVTPPGKQQSPEAASKRPATLIVQELCTGGNLREAMNRGRIGSVAFSKGSLEQLKLVAQIGQQLACALAHAHSHGVVHCDVKPENVLLQRLLPELQQTGLDVCVKLADFSVAHVVPLAQVQKGTVSMSYGAVAYMPPEVVGAPHWVTPKTDIWSLGILLWELWCQQPPFQGMDQQQAIAAISAMRLPAWPSNTPPILVQLASLCCCEDPAARPLARTLAKDLAKVADMPVRVLLRQPNRSRDTFEDDDEELEEELLKLKVELARAGGAGGYESRADSASTENSILAAMDMEMPPKPVIAQFLWCICQGPPSDQLMEVAVTPTCHMVVGSLPSIQADLQCRRFRSLSQEE